MARARHLSPRKIRNARYDGEIALGSINSDIRARRRDVMLYETRATDAFRMKQTMHESLLLQSDRLANMIEEAAQLPETLNFARRALAEDIEAASRETEITLGGAVRHARQFDAHIIGLHAEQHKLETLERKLVRTPADQLANVVRSHPMVNPRAQVVFSTMDGRTQVTFTTKPVILRPNCNPYKWIDNGEIPYVQLGAMQICADLATAEVRIFPATRNAIVRHAYCSQRTAHPHILDHQLPCLGDFTSPLVSAVEAGDVSFFLDTLYVFLTTAADEDAAGRNWVRWVYEDAQPGHTDAPSRDGKYLSVTTKPDGTITHQWKRPTLEPKPLPGLVPAATDYDFWDGKSIPKTGQIAYLNTTPVWLAWADDVLMYNPAIHPACGVTDLGIIDPGMDILSPVLPENQFQVAQRVPYRCTPKQEYWQLYQHDGYEPVVSPVLFTFPRSTSDTPISTPSFNGTCRPNGPMSRPVDLATVDFGNAPNMVDIKFTPTPSTPVSLAYCVMKSFDTIGDDLRIGAYTTRGFIVSPPQVNDEGETTYRVCREPFRPNTSSFSTVRTMQMEFPLHPGIIYARPLGELPLPKRIAVVQEGIRTTSPAPVSRVQQMARQWYADGYTEEHFIPALWEQIAPYMQEAATHTEETLAGTTPTNNTVRVVLRDGQFVICA